MVRNTKQFPAFQEYPVKRQGTPASPVDLLACLPRKPKIRNPARPLRYQPMHRIYVSTLLPIFKSSSEIYTAILSENKTLIVAVDASIGRLQ